MNSGMEKIEIAREILDELEDLKKELSLDSINGVIEFLLRNYYENMLLDVQNQDYKLLPYPGGDFYIKDRIIDLLKKSDARVLVEVFGGSGVISTHARRYFKIVVYNDIDDLVVSFFRVLKERPRELIRALSYLPFSRSLKKEFQEKVEKKQLDSELDKAVAIFYLCNASINAKLTSGFKVSRVCDYTHRVNNKIKAIYRLAGIWRTIVIENCDFRKIFELYDSDATVFYCDPPYIDRDYYRFSFRKTDMIDLLSCLKNIKGKFILKLHEDQLKMNFVKEFADKYYMMEIKNIRHMCVVSAGMKKPEFNYILIHNFKYHDSVQTDFNEFHPDANEKECTTYD